MTLVSGLVVFFITWWVVFFMALPIGAKTNMTPETGHDTGAPMITYLREKFLFTTLVTILLWFGIDYLISINAVDLRTLGRDL